MIILVQKQRFAKSAGPFSIFLYVLYDVTTSSFYGQTGAVLHSITRSLATPLAATIRISFTLLRTAQYWYHCTLYELFYCIHTYSPFTYVLYLSVLITIQYVSIYCKCRREAARSDDGLVFRRNHNVDQCVCTHSGQLFMSRAS
jgi:hypothetical protein